MLMEKQQGLMLLAGIVNDPAQTDKAVTPERPAHQPANAAGKDLAGPH